MKKKSTISNPLKAGDGATIIMWSDQIACTIIQVTRNGKRIVIQEDIATRTDGNGMSDSQSYEYQPNTNGKIHIATLRKDGRYKITGSPTVVSVAGRSHFYDYSF